MIGVHPACVLKMLVFCNPSIHYACKRTRKAIPCIRHRYTIEGVILPLKRKLLLAAHKLNMNCFETGNR
jgi:hypothetical protein